MNCRVVEQSKIDYDLLNERLTSLKKELSDLSEQVIRERKEKLKVREVIWNVSIL